MIVIAAMTENRIIGSGNAMPWRIPAEFRHFRKTTLGHTLIMGRKTFETLGGRPLRRRNNIVVSRSLPETEGIDVCRTFEQALEKAKTYGKKIFIAGGADIYRQALPLADTLYLSYIKENYSGDTTFPEFHEADWAVTRKKDYPEFTFVVYKRKHKIE